MQENSQSEALVHTIHDALNIIYKKANYGEGVDQSILHPPATATAIREFEARRFRIPPSYRSFLERHDGWEHFWTNMTLIGVAENHHAAVDGEVAETVKWQNEHLAGVLGNLSKAAIANWEQESQRNMYLPNHRCLATNFAGDFYFWDQRTLRSDGEMTIVYWNIAYGGYEDPWADFRALLQGVADEVTSELAKHQKVKKRGK